MPRRTTNIKILYLDIETTPHSGTFWNLWPKFIPIGQITTPTEILCWSAKWGNEREIMFYSHRDKDMVHTMWDLLDEADAVVHYNGTAFDMKHLNREFVLEGLPPPSHYHQIDLLKTVRKNFKLASNKLDWVVKYFGLGGKVKHAGIELWYGCMANDQRDWKIMERYNKQDVKLLPRLYKFLLPWISNHPNLGMWVVNPSKPTCPRCASTDLVKKGTQHNTKVASYDRYRCNKCGTPSSSRLRSKTTSSNVLIGEG